MKVEITPANYLEKVIAILSEAGVCEIGKKQSAYMRNKFPFYGVTAPETKPIYHP